MENGLRFLQLPRDLALSLPRALSVLSTSLPSLPALTTDMRAPQPGCLALLKTEEQRTRVSC